MKKVTTTLERFREALRALPEEMGVAEHVREWCARHGIDEDLEGADLLTTEARPAPARGLGERVIVHVFTLWNEPPYSSPQKPLCHLRERLLRVPGVEEVGEATVDTQLRALWGVDVTLRLSQ